MPNYSDFEKSPDKYKNQCYQEGDQHYRNIEPRLRENWQLYNLVSDLLQERAALDDGRSVLFIPLIYPHTESRTATIDSEVLSNQDALKFKPWMGSPNLDQDQLKADKCNAAVDFAMYVSEWEDKLDMWVQASEIYPIIVAKVYVDEIYAEEGELQEIKPGAEDLSEEQKQEYIAEVNEKSKTNGGRVHTIKDLPELLASLDIALPMVKRLNYTDKPLYTGPNFTILSPHEILYDPKVRTLSESPYIIHRKRVDWFYLMTHFKEKVKDRVDEINKQKVGLWEDYDYEEEKQVGRAENDQKTRRTWLLVEMWYKYMDSDGKVKIKVCWFLPQCQQDDGKEIFELDEKTPKELKMAGVNYPFVELTLRPRPNKLEGMATADILVPFQHEKSDLHNIGIESLARSFPVVLQEQGAILSPKHLDFSIGAVWTVSRKDAVNTLTVPQINLEWILQYMRLVDESAQNTSSAYDFIMGSQFIKTDQTLGEARIKQGGAGRRIGRSILQVMKALKKLRFMFLKILQQTITPEFEARLTGANPSIKSFTVEDLLVNVDIYIPNLPSLADKALKQVTADRNWERLISSPIVASSEEAQFELLKDYLTAYEFPADRKQAVLDAVQRGIAKRDLMPILLETIVGLSQKFGLPLPPQIQMLVGQLAQGQGKGQTKTQTPKMPLTQSTLGASTIPG